MAERLVAVHNLRQGRRGGARRFQKQVRGEICKVNIPAEKIELFEADRTAAVRIEKKHERAARDNTGDGDVYVKEVPCDGNTDNIVVSPPPRIKFWLRKIR